MMRIYCCIIGVWTGETWALITMKILHVETGRHFYGGAQQVVWLANGLGSCGVGNTLACTPDAAIGAVAAGAGIDVRELRCAGDLDITFVWRLRQLITELHPDVVHCHSRRGADFLGGQAAAMAGVPAVVSRRVDHAEPGLMANLRYRPFRRVVAVSDNVAGVLRSNGLDAARIVVIRDAVDASRYAVPADRRLLQANFGITPEQFAVAIVAQLIERKGHRYLFEALAALRERDLRLVVFGTGPLDATLGKLIDDMGLSSIVQMAGFRDDLDDYLGAFDLLVHPATREGLGVAMLKAAAAGLPVVAFDRAGAREAVEHEKTGLLVPAGDVAALAAAMTRMIDNPAERRRFGEAGRARMVREFSIEEMVKAHVELYESVRDDS